MGVFTYMCWKTIIGSTFGRQRHIATSTAMKCEVCRAIETLSLESSAHDWWACSDASCSENGSSNHPLRRRSIARHNSTHDKSQKAAGSFRIRWLHLLPRH